MTCGSTTVKLKGLTDSAPLLETHTFCIEVWVLRIRVVLTARASLFPTFLTVRSTYSSLQSPFIMRICYVLREGFILIICCKVLIVKATACYWPNATEAEWPDGIQVCNSTVDGADSGCCATGDICTNKGFCISNEVGYMYRGACTNQAWNLDVCFSECLDGGIAPKYLVKTQHC